jgi:hypothetical protein
VSDAVLCNEQGNHATLRQAEIETEAEEIQITYGSTGEKSSVVQIRNKPQSSSEVRTLNLIEKGRTV